MEPPIDLNYLQQLSEGDSNFELELLQVFVEDTKLHLEAAEKALASEDRQMLEREAHHVKGASGNVGAYAMQVLSMELEQKSHHQPFDISADMLKQLNTHLLDVESFMKIYLGC